MKKKQIQILLMILMMTALTAVFAYLDSFETNAETLRRFEFSTSTPVFDPTAQSGWWNEMPGQ